MRPDISAAIDRFAAAASALNDALVGLTAADLIATPVPGTWSIQQIVLHLVDSDLVMADRMKRIIAEDIPLLVGFDESAWAKRLDYGSSDPHLAAEVFRLNRLHLAAILRRQSDETFDRYGIHTQAGKKTLLDFLTGYYGDHLDHHMGHLRRKRELLGKPLS